MQIEVNDVIFVKSQFTSYEVWAKDASSNNLVFFTA